MPCKSQGHSKSFLREKMTERHARPNKNHQTALSMSLTSCSTYSADESHDTSLTKRMPHPSLRSNRYFTFDDDRRELKISMEEVVVDDLVEEFAMNKRGCKFLQDHFPDRGPLKDKLYALLASKGEILASMSQDVFANFYAQMLVVNADSKEKRQWIMDSLKGNVRKLCFNRYSCRVIQRAIEILPRSLRLQLLEELSVSNCLQLASDQNGNHVIQKIMTCCKVENWGFLVEQLVSEPGGFFLTIESKYGCRVVQIAVDKLAAQATDSYTPPGCINHASILLNQVLEQIMENCERLVCNEYANYVVQEILKLPSLSHQRDQIIQNCLLGNLLSFSQEKFASHVVEMALQQASPGLLYCMMEELFDGYVPDPVTHLECLDILIFHQFGNYVVQRMLFICINWLETMKQTKPGPIINRQQLSLWAQRLEALIDDNAPELSKYSSGKRIISALNQFRSFGRQITTV